MTRQPDAFYFTGSTGTVAVFKEIDPDHFQLLEKFPPELYRKPALGT